METIWDSLTPLHRKWTKKLNWISEFILKSAFSMNIPWCGYNSYSNICIQNTEWRGRRLWNGVLGGRCKQSRHFLHLWTSLVQCSQLIVVEWFTYLKSKHLGLSGLPSQKTSLQNTLPDTQLSLHPMFFFSIHTEHSRDPYHHHRDPTHQTTCLPPTPECPPFRKESSLYLSIKISVDHK